MNKLIKLCPLVLGCLMQLSARAQLYIDLEDGISDTIEYYQVNSYDLGKITNCVLHQDTTITLTNTSLIAIVINEKDGYSILKSPEDTLKITGKHPYLSKNDSLLWSWHSDALLSLNKNNASRESILKSFEHSSNDLNNPQYVGISPAVKSKYIKQLKIIALTTMLKKHMSQLLDSTFVGIHEDLRSEIIEELRDTNTYSFNSSYGLVNWFIVLERNQFNKASLWEACDDLDIPFNARKHIMSYLYNITVLRPSERNVFPEDLALKYSLKHRDTNTSNNMFHLDK